MESLICELHLPEPNEQSEQSSVQAHSAWQRMSRAGPQLGSVPSLEISALYDSVLSRVSRAELALLTLPSLFAPPNEPMFWNLKEAHLKGRNKQRRKSDPFESSTREPVVIQLQDHTGHRYPETPMRPRAKSFDISPVRGFNPRQYNSGGLLAYLQWLDNTYPDDGYLEIFPILSHEMLGIDIFKTATARDGSAKELVTELKKDLGIKVGIAPRLVEKF